MRKRFCDVCEGEITQDNWVIRAGAMTIGIDDAWQGEVLDNDLICQSCIIEAIGKIWMSKCYCGMNSAPDRHGSDCPMHPGYVAAGKTAINAMKEQCIHGMTLVEECSSCNATHGIYRELKGHKLVRKDLHTSPSVDSYPVDKRETPLDAGIQPYNMQRK